MYRRRVLGRHRRWVWLHENTRSRSPMRPPDVRNFRSFHLHLLLNVLHFILQRSHDSTQTPNFSGERRHSSTCKACGAGDYFVVDPPPPPLVVFVSARTSSSRVVS